MLLGGIRKQLFSTPKPVRFGVLTNSKFSTPSALYEITVKNQEEIASVPFPTALHQFSAMATRAIYALMLNKREEALYFAKTSLAALLTVVPDHDYGTTSTIGFIFKVSTTSFFAFIEFAV